MNRIKDFIKVNYVGLLIGLFFFLLYLQFTFAGNRICDCESTERYNESSGSRTGGVNRFYHK